MACRTVNELWNGLSLHNKTITVLQHYKIKAQSINFITSVIWWKMCRIGQMIVTPSDNPTMEQRNETKWSRLLNRLLKACCMIVWQWHKEELMQKKIVYIFIKQVSSMWSKNQVFCPYAIYTHTHTLTS